jgi:tetratricopeptide (TPR) repeat protein
MHRSLKQHVLHIIHESGDDYLQVCFDRALKMVRKAYPMGSPFLTPKNELWAQCESVLPHVLSLNYLYQKWSSSICGSLPFATLLVDTTNYMWERGLTDTAVEVIDLGVGVCKLLDDDDEVAPYHANLLCIAGAIHGEIGFSGRERSLDVYERCLKLCQQRVNSQQRKDAVSIADIMNLANAHNDMGVIRIQSGLYGESISHFEESLELKRKWTSEAEVPWHFGETYKNLAFVKLSQGKLEEAKDFASRAKKMCSRGMAEKSAATQKACFVEATILLNCGDLENSAKSFKSILRVRNEIFGPGHMLTKDAVYVIGEIYRLRGKLEKAEYVYFHVEKRRGADLLHYRTTFRSALDESHLWP